MIALLKRFMRPYGLKALAGILTKMVEVVFEVLTPLVVAHMIDAGVGRSDVGEVIRSGVVLLVFALVSYAFTFVCQRFAAQVSQGLGTDVRNALYRQVNTLSASEVDRFGAPSLVTRVTNDVSQVQLAVALTIRMATRWPLLAVGSMVAAVTIDVRLGLVFMVCMPLVALVFALVMRASVPFFRAMQGKLDGISLVVRETLSGMRVIRAFGREEDEEACGRAAVTDQSMTAIEQGRLSALLNPATFLIMNVGVCVILWLGGVRVNDGRLTTGEIVAFVSYMTQALVAITALANLVVVIMRGQTSAGRIMEVLDAVPSVSDEGNVPVVLSNGVGGAAVSVPALELRDVSFVYEGANVEALSCVSLAVEAGGTLGVIGGTGSGKTTLNNLLTRLYDVSGGQVMVFGADVRSYPFAQLRNVVSVVPQNVSLVSGTIRSNLLWRDAGADDAELERALAVAQASDFVHALPEGLDAVVEAGGCNFSGGQRQRLTIARALVGHPRLLVLDDAASALDYATDARLRKALHGLKDELTCVIVSQRVSAVRGADQILVLDHGRMAGLGTHDELLATCRLYQEICASQLKADDDSRMANGRGTQGGEGASERG